MGGQPHALGWNSMLQLDVATHYPNPHQPMHSADHPLPSPVWLLAVQVQQRLSGQQQDARLLGCPCGTRPQVLIRQGQQLPQCGGQGHHMLVCAALLCRKQLVVGQAAHRLHMGAALWRIVSSWVVNRRSWFAANAAQHLQAAERKGCVAPTATSTPQSFLSPGHLAPQTWPSPAA